MDLIFVLFGWGWLALGFLVGSLGPTILLLAENVGQTRDGIGFVFSARGSGWVAGNSNHHLLSLYLFYSYHLFLFARNRSNNNL
jgi:hypothetical protein